MTNTSIEAPAWPPTGEWICTSRPDGRRHTLVACAYPGTHDLEESIRRHVKYMDAAADGGADLIVFPEISLQGYPPRVPGSLAQAIATAERVPEGPSVRALLDHARRRGIYVVFGVNEAVEKTGLLYNTAVLGGPEGYIGCFRKGHIPLREREFYMHGTDWPVFTTKLGRIGMLICYDLHWPEAARELTLRGADILIAPKAWPRGSMYEAHQLLFETARAAENGRWLVSTNYAGELDGNVYPGAARIIDPLGRVVAATERDAGLAVARVDLTAGLIDWITAYHGNRLMRDRQPEGYRALRGEIMPEGT